MAICSELRAIVRWLARRPDPLPPPHSGQDIQAAEQAAARSRLSDLARRRQAEYRYGRGDR